MKPRHWGMDFGPAQSSGGDRRRRHGNRLRGYVGAPWLHRHRPTGNHAPAAGHPPADNPWPEWPRTFRTDYGQEEAREIFGRDPREFSILAKRFIGDANDRVAEVHTVRVEWEQRDGRSSFRELPGTEQRWPAHLVLLAMGFLGPESTLVEQFGLEQDARSNVRTHEGAPEYGKFTTRRARRVRGRGYASRAKPGRLGHQRGARRGPRVRPLPDGGDALAVRAVDWREHPHRFSSQRRRSIIPIRRPARPLCAAVRPGRPPGLPGCAGDPLPCR